jgi:HK97 family phage major capsid protein
MSETNALQKGTLFSPELVTEIMSLVKGHSTLAKLSDQKPIPFTGTTEFVFSLDGHAQIVGEGNQKKAGKAVLTPKVISPVKIMYQARVTDEFLRASEEKKVNFLKTFAEGFSKKIAEAFDIAALHGLESHSMTDASFKATNSFDGLVTGNVVNFAAATFDDNLDTAIQTLVDKEVTGIALSPTAKIALSKIKDKNGVALYPEFKFTGTPEHFYGTPLDINKTLELKSTAGKADHAIVGDFANAFKWGYAENIPLEIIEYGDPDGRGRDLKAFNEVCLRAEAFIGWGILDEKAFARVVEA